MAYLNVESDNKKLSEKIRKANVNLSDEINTVVFNKQAYNDVYFASRKLIDLVLVNERIQLNGIVFEDDNIVLYTNNNVINTAKKLEDGLYSIDGSETHLSVEDVMKEFTFKYKFSIEKLKLSYGVED